MVIILLAILFLSVWAIVHGGTREKQPSPIDQDSESCRRAIKQEESR